MVHLCLVTTVGQRMDEEDLKKKMSGWSVQNVLECQQHSGNIQTQMAALDWKR